MRPGYVYFVKPKDAAGPIKIGCCAHNLENRLRGIQMQCPVELELLAILPGHLDVEQRFHTMFLDARTHGEWFRPTPKLLELIAQIRRGGFLPEVLPEGRKIKAERSFKKNRLPVRPFAAAPIPGSLLHAEHFR